MRNKYLKKWWFLLDEDDDESWTLKNGESCEPTFKNSSGQVLPRIHYCNWYNYLYLQFVFLVKYVRNKCQATMDPQEIEGFD